MKRKLIISAVMLLLGFYLTNLSFTDYANKKKETETYEQTTCEILVLKRIKGFARNSVRIADKVILRYRYYVNGVEYIGSNFSNGEGELIEFENKYSEQKIFNVYYNPVKPEESVLILGGRKFFWDGAMIVGTILIVIGVICLLSLKFKFFQSLWISISE